MSWDAYRGWIILGADRRFGHPSPLPQPRWARLADGWLAIAPTLLPNEHERIVPATVLDEEGPFIHEVACSIDEASDLLTLGRLLTEAEQTLVRSVRFGCVACFDERFAGTLILDPIWIGDLGYRCVPDADPDGPNEAIW